MHIRIKQLQPPVKFKEAGKRGGKMYCASCGKMLPEHAKFCGGCGKPVIQLLNLQTGAPDPWMEMPGSAIPADMTGQRGWQPGSAMPADMTGQQSRQPGFTMPADMTGQRGWQPGFTMPADMAGLPSRLANVGTADNNGSSLRRFYIIDFLARMVGVKENLPLFIYLLLNVFLIGLATTAFIGGDILWGMLIGLILYAVSMTAALSPFGEWLLRRRVGCEPIKDQAVADRINPLFQQVYERAKTQNPNLPDDIKLFVNDDDSPNAFATGRRTVCITKGLLTMSDEQIRGTLGHEFGHLAHRDTDRILVVSIGNTFITAICVLAQISAVFFEIFTHILAIFMGEDGIFVALMASLSRFMTIVLIGLFMKVWTWIGTALCMKTSRGNEYQADEFSCRLGYGYGLSSMLQALDSSPKPEGLFAALASSHPATEDRITRIQYFMNGMR